MANLLLFISLVIALSQPSYAQDVTETGQQYNTIIQLNSCEQSYQDFQCDNLRKDSELSPYIKKCNSSDHSFTNYELIKTCSSQAAGIWGDALKTLQKSPQLLMSSLSKSLKKEIAPQVRLHKWKKYCLKTRKCLENLIQAAYRKSLSQQDIEKYIQQTQEAWIPNQKFNYYFNKAVNRDGFGHNTDPWFKSQMARIFPRKVSKRSNIFLQMKTNLRENYSKWQCLNNKGATALNCYVFFSIVDPALAFAIYTKAPKLAKLINRLAKKKGSTAKGLRISQKIHPIWTSRDKSLNTKPIAMEDWKTWGPEDYDPYYGKTVNFETPNPKSLELQNSIQVLSPKHMSPSENTAISSLVTRVRTRKIEVELGHLTITKKNGQVVNINIDNYSSKQIPSSSVVRAINNSGISESNIARVQFFHNHPSRGPLSSSDLEAARGWTQLYAQDTPNRFPIHIYSVSDFQDRFVIFHYAHQRAPRR